MKGEDARTVLRLEGITKAFGAVSVLRGVSLSIARGEVHALLGENGAGKSTLMKVIVGRETHDAGEMRLGGGAEADEAARVYAPSSPLAARRSGVVMVPQERTLAGHLSVAENIVLGLEPGKGPFIDRRASEALAKRALDLVTGEGTARAIALSTRARDLSVADQQLVEIARALAQGGVNDAGTIDAKVLVLDEPTASLGKDDADRLFARVLALKETGLAVVLVTHFLGDVRTYADRYTVLRDGVVRGEGDPKVTPAENIVHEMLGKALEEAMTTAAEETSRDASTLAANDAEVLLEVSSLEGVAKPKRATFVLRRGEIFGVAGLVGSGRTELLRVVVGLDAVRAGKVDVRAPKGVGLLSEDRGGEGLMLDRSIADNVTLSRRGSWLSSPRKVLAEGARWIAELSVRASGPDQRAGSLSGGNQQKVQLARLLREDYDVLLVDEPTRGIDVASKAQVLELLRDLARRGKGIVLVSSQLDELVTTCDRIAVLRGGVLGEAKKASEWTEEKLLLEAAS